MLRRYAVVISFVTVFFAGWINSLAAQPFGISMGTPLSDLTVVLREPDGNHYVTPPRTHPLIESPIGVFAAPVAGVCQVTAVSRFARNDRFGGAIRQIFDELRQQLSNTYGESTLTDTIRPGAIWTSAADWVMAIRQSERSYVATWGRRDGPAIRNDVAEVTARVLARSSTESFVLLIFIFTNAQKCVDEIRNITRQAF